MDDLLVGDLDLNGWYYTTDYVGFNLVLVT